MKSATAVANNVGPKKNVITRVLYQYRNRKKNIDYDALTQFVEGLRSDLELARKEGESSDSRSHSIAEKISTKLDEADKHEIALDGKWNLAHHAEKLILTLLGTERQKIELHRRLSECQRINAPFTAFYKDQVDRYEKESRFNEQCFNILVSLVGDMQHYNSNKHIKMRYARHAIYRVGLTFSLALILFLSIISLFHWV
ncbi:MAG: hypothetical protein AB8B64_04970 [Granulosicoccus sp.]